MSYPLLHALLLTSLLLLCDYIMRLDFNNNKKEIKKLLKLYNINIDISKEIESMKRLGCYYFRATSVCGLLALTIDLRKYYENNKS